MKTIELLSEVKKLKKGFKNSSYLPILDNIYNNEGTMTVFDLEIAMTVKTGLPGKFLVDFKLFEKILTKLPKDSEITSELSEDKITLTIDGGGKFTLPTYNVDDYPNIVKCENLLGELTEQDIELIKKAEKFAVESMLRPVLQSIFITDHIVASDAHRLVYYPHEMKLTKPILLTNKVAKIMNEKHYFVDSDKDGKNIKLVGSNEIITYRQFDGNYPHYMSVIPKDNGIVYSVDTKKLTETVKLALISANQSSELIKFNFNCTKVTVSSQDIYFSTEFSQDIDCKRIASDLDNFKIGMKASFLLDMLSDCEEVVTFAMKSTDRAILIDDDKLLMPMMIN